MSMIDAYFLLNCHFISGFFFLWSKQMFSGLDLYCSGIKTCSGLTVLSYPGLAHWKGRCFEWDRMALRSSAFWGFNQGILSVFPALLLTLCATSDFSLGASKQQKRLSQKFLSQLLNIFTAFEWNICWVFCCLTSVKTLIRWTTCFDTRHWGLGVCCWSSQSENAWFSC